MAKYNWRAHKNTRIRYWSTNESGDSLTFNSPGTYNISWSTSNSFSTSPILTVELLRTTADTILNEGLSAPRCIVHPSVISAFGNWPAEE